MFPSRYLSEPPLLIMEGPGFEQTQPVLQREPLHGSVGSHHQPARAMSSAPENPPACPEPIVMNLHRKSALKEKKSPAAPPAGERRKKKDGNKKKNAEDTFKKKNLHFELGFSFGITSVGEREETANDGDTVCFST